MNWSDVLAKIFEIVIIPLLGIATVYLTFLIKTKINVLKQKANNEQVSKYLDILDRVVTEAIITTNQTYVESLKQQGKFDAEAQETAFEMSYDAVWEIISKELEDTLSLFIDDLDSYIKNKIETEVSYNKSIRAYD